MRILYKRISVVIIITILCCFSTSLYAQGFFGNRGFLFQRDSLNINISIFDILDSRTPNLSSVNLNQSSNIPLNYSAYREIIVNRRLDGYRIRIFFDNKQDSRVRSEELVNEFVEKFPDIPAYRSHTNPFFKVTVGDFRNMSDAMRLLKILEGDYPLAFIVRESINPPR